MGVTALEPCVDALVASCNSSYLDAECTHATGPCVTLRFGVVSCLEGYCTLALLLLLLLLRSHEGRHFWTRFTRVFGVSVLPLIDSLAGQFLRLTCPASRHEQTRNLATRSHTLTHAQRRRRRRRRPKDDQVGYYETLTPRPHLSAPSFLISLP